MYSVLVVNKKHQPKVGDKKKNPCFKQFILPLKSVHIFLFAKTLIEGQGLLFGSPHLLMRIAGCLYVKITPRVPPVISHFFIKCFSPGHIFT